MEILKFKKCFLCVGILKLSSFRVPGFPNITFLSAFARLILPRASVPVLALPLVYCQNCTSVNFKHVSGSAFTWAATSFSAHRLMVRSHTQKTDAIFLLVKPSLSKIEDPRLE